MGIADWFKRGKKMAADNEDAVMDGIDKVGDMVDEKTDDRYADQVDQGQEAAKDFVEGLDTEA